MSTVIDILGPGNTVLAEALDSREVVMPFVLQTLNTAVRSSVSPRDITVRPVPLVGPNDPDAPAPVLPLSQLTYRKPRYAYLYIAVQVRGDVVYRHHHRVGEAVDPGLANWLERNPGAERAVAFTVRRVEQSLASARSLASAQARSTRSSRSLLRLRPTPAVEGAADIEPNPQRPAEFRIRRIAEPPAPLAKRGQFVHVTEFDPADSSCVEPIPTGPTRPVTALVAEAVARELCRTRQFSREVEEGGFLLGHVYRDSLAPERHLAVVTEAVQAEQSGASLLHFVFTGDSFEAVKRYLHHHDGRLLGWYHTHLFPATASFGLSSVDVQLHFTTFRIPWQLAGLVNIAPRTGERVLRFYARQGNAMVRCAHDVVPAGTDPVRIADSEESSHSEERS